MDNAKAPTHEMPVIDLGAERNGAPEEMPADETKLGQAGINVGGQTVTRATETLPEEQRDLVRWLHEYARKNKLNWHELEKATEIDSSTIWRVFVDKYRYSKGQRNAGERIGLDGICGRIKTFKRKCDAAGRVKNPDFIRLSTSERIFWLSDRVARNNRMGFIYGDGQVGVTTALKEFSSSECKTGRAYYIDMPPGGGVHYVLKHLARALDVSAGTAVDKLLDTIIGALDSGKTLLWDEMDRVFTCFSESAQVRVLETIRWIFGQTGCGMVMAGNNRWRDEIEAGKFKMELRRFNRRGKTYELQLPTEPPKEDLDLMAVHFHLDAPQGDALEIVNHIAKNDGIGVYKLNLVDATDLARKKGEPVNWNHFIKAYSITQKAGQRLTPRR